MEMPPGYDAWKLATPDDEPHWPACEDADGFFCTTCNVLIEAGLKSKNWCESCGKFARRIDRCVCSELDYRWL